MKKRILSICMALVMCLSLLPTAALAEGESNTAATNKTLMLGASGISDYDSTSSYDYIYFGNWTATDEYTTVTLTVDNTPPTLTAGTATRNDESTATVTFESSEAGTYYYTVTENGAAKPEQSDILNSTSADCTDGSNTIFVTGLSDAAPKKIYVVAKDAAGNISKTLEIEIPLMPIYSLSVDDATLELDSLEYGYTEVESYTKQGYVFVVNRGNVDITLVQPTAENYIIGTLTQTDLAEDVAAVFTIQPKAGLAVGTYNETINIADSTGNATASVDVKFSVVKKSISITSADAVDRDYEKGNTTVEIDSVTFSDGVTLTKGTDYTATGTMATEDAGENKEVSVTVTLTDSAAAKNYTLTENTTTTTVKIEKISYTGSKTTGGSAPYGATGEVDLTDLVELGGKLEITGTTDTDSVLNGNASLDGNTLKFAFNDADTLISESASITVTVKDCKNYEDYKILVTVSVTDKQAPTVTANAITQTYSGEALTNAVITGETGGVKGTWSWKEGKAPKDVADSTKTWTVVFTPDDTANYKSVEKTVSVTITAKPLTITAESKTAIVGATMPELTYSVSGLCGSDTLTTEPTLSCTATDTNTIGAYPITATGGDAGMNYTISNYVEGTLTVSNKQTPTLTLTPSNGSLSGGGTVTLTVGGLPGGASCAVSCDAAGVTPTGSGSSWSVTLPNTTATYTFTVTFAGNDAYNSATATCTVSVTQYTAPVTPTPDPDPTPDVPSYVPTPTPNTGNSNKNDKTDKTDKTETVTNPDGSTTTTETKKDGTVVETTKNEDGSESKTETQKDGTVTETNTTATGTTATTVTDDEGNVTESKVTVSTEDAQSDETVTLPVQDVKPTDKSEDAQEITVEIPEDTTVTVEIPVEDVTPGTVVVIVDEDGNETVVSDTKLTENGVSVTLDGNVTIKIVDNSKDFDDVDEDYWGKNAIDFVSSRELFSGVNENEYAPEETMTRAMLFTVLARLDGQDTTHDGDGAWYQKSMDWAKDAGISDGTDPNGSITREQLATMLYRYAGEPEVSGENGTDKFSDHGSVSDWAAKAMQWAVENGILNGMDDGTLNPQGEATRTQVATMLMRFVNAAG